MVRGPRAGDKFGRPLGLVLYDGPSLIDGRPVTLVLTGIGHTSRNYKTGPMLQTWVLRSDLDPAAAVATDADASVCGTCKFRGRLGKGRACYVVVIQAPQQVYAGYVRGDYAPATPALLRRWVRGRAVRLGSYGDPAAVPLAVWKNLLKAATAAAGSLARFTVRRGRKGHTGYTQRWAACEPGFREFLMASVASEEEYAQAKALGWRTYRVRQKGDRKLPGEAHCPSSPEGKFRSDCFGCRLCDGAGHGPDVTVVAHGSRPVLANMRRSLALVSAE